MNTGSLIIGLILLFICILPIYLFSLSSKMKKKKMLQAISSIADKQNCHIGEFEICGDLAIGWDEPKNFIFFFRKANDTITELSLALADIKSCKMLQTTKTIKQKEGNQKITDRVELNFSPLLAGNHEVKWEFYNDEINTQLNGELQLADKWSKLIANRLKSK